MAMLGSSETSSRASKRVIFSVNSPPTLETAQSKVGFSVWKSNVRRVVSDAPSTTPENPEDRVPPTPGRTYNRIRSPSKESRQNGFVTSGKGFTLRAGHGGPSPEPVDCRWTARAAPAARVGHRVPVRGWTRNGSLGGFPRASNSRLRIGTDKGNPTV
uniref:Uncharacterized protein n=1 Tax=Vitis vinifera TaxID=29760 RepID=A5B939_VITVI|nr:hypothetical protein VITISV_022570 [Vitis vinifera]